MRGIGNEARRRLGWLTLLSARPMLAVGILAAAVLATLGTLGASHAFANGVSKSSMASGGSSAAASASMYRETDMGTLGGAFALAFAVNNSAQATGVSLLADNATVHGFFWQNGVMTDLGTLGGTFVQSNSINDRAQVVGIATLPGDASFHAFLWQNGVMTDLGTLGGADSEAWWINNAGQIAGGSLTASGDDHAFLWDHGVIRDLGTLGGTSSVAFGVDENGDAVGGAAVSPAASCSPGDQTTFAGCHAFKWAHGTMTDLGTLGGSWSVANPSSNRDVIGFSALPGDANYSAFLSAAGRMRPLAPATGDPNSVANGANDLDQVVGSSGDQIFDVGPNRAMLWQNGSGADLNTLIPSNSPLFLLWAFGINERGQIVGQGSAADGSVHPFLLTPASADGSRLGKSHDGAHAPQVAPHAPRFHMPGH